MSRQWATMTERSSCFKVWLRNDAAVEVELLANRPAEAELTAYGDNDSVLDYLMASGLWTILTGMEADGLKCRNGYRPAVLNGVEVIRELAGVGRIQQCGKVLCIGVRFLKDGVHILGERNIRLNEEAALWKTVTELRPVHANDAPTFFRKQGDGGTADTARRSADENSLLRFAFQCSRF